MSGDSSRVELPLFQGENGGSIPTSPLHFIVRMVNQETTQNWIEAWHYSRRVPTGKNLPYGLYCNNLLYAVIVYGIGVNPYQEKFLNAKRVIEIKRLARSEPQLPYPMSKFISLTAKMVAKEFPYDCIIAFADPAQGHLGTVYKASGFTLHGMTNGEWHTVDDEGIIRHRRFAFRHARRNNQSLARSREELHLKRIQTEPKYRWVRFFK